MSSLSETIRQQVRERAGNRCEYCLSHQDYVMGLTATGRATIRVLALNDALAVTVRRNWVKAGWRPQSFY